MTSEQWLILGLSGLLEKALQKAVPGRLSTAIMTALVPASLARKMERTACTASTNSGLPASPLFDKCLRGEAIREIVSLKRRNPWAGRRIVFLGAERNDLTHKRCVVTVKRARPERRPILRLEMGGVRNSFLRADLPTMA